MSRTQSDTVTEGSSVGVLFRGTEGPTQRATALPAPWTEQPLQSPAFNEPADNAVGSGPNTRTIWQAFRRIWVWVVLLGVPVGAASAFGAWRYTPDTFTATSMLSLAATEPRLVFETADQSADFALYRQTQRALISSPFVLNAALNRPAVRDVESIRGQVDPVSWLEHRLRVDFPGNAQLLRIMLSDSRPEDAMALVNAVTDAYLEEIVNVERDKRLSRIGELERLYKEKENEIQRQRTTYQKLAKSLGTTNTQALTVKQETSLQHLAALRAKELQTHFDLLDANVKLAAAKKKLETFKSLPIDEETVESLLMNDPQIATLAERRRDALNVVADYRRVSASKGNPHLARHIETVQRLEENLNGAIAIARPRIEQKLRQQLTSDAMLIVSQAEETADLLQKQKEMLAEEAKQYDGEARRVGSDSSDLEFLRREITQAEAIVDRIRNEYEALRVEQQSPPRVRLLHAAELPAGADPSRRAKLSLLGGLGGAGLVLAGLLFFELSARRIGGIDEVQRALRMRVVGAIPYQSARGAQSIEMARSRGARRLRQQLADAVDCIRAVVLRQERTENCHVFMITSAVGAEGKTTLAYHLAVSLARAGRRTLLVDGDLRAPKAHQVVGGQLSPGLCDLLEARVGVDTALQYTRHDGLLFISAGESKSESTLAQNGELLARLLERWRAEYDFVIIDSPPVLPVSDSLSLAQLADRVLFTVRRDHSRLPQVRAAVGRLLMLGVPILGTVVLGVSEDQCYFDYYSSDTQRRAT